MAHELLHGLRQEAPGTTLLGFGRLVGFRAGVVMHDVGSLLMEDGEVLSFLWWPGDTLEAMFQAWPEDLLPREPGQEALRWLARSMGKQWGSHVGATRSAPG